jgi:hypothetical protein
LDSPDENPRVGEVFGLMFDLMRSFGLILAG